MSDPRLDSIAALLRETFPAHHRAYLDTDGADAEWPLWYADYALGRMRSVLGRDLTKSDLVYLLVASDREHRASGSSEEWPVFYARRILADHG